MHDDHLDLFFNLSHDLLCVCNSEGYFVRVNPAFMRVLGHPESDLLSRPYLDFVHPEDRERTLAIAEVIAAGIATDHFENRYVCQDGSYRWLSWGASAATTMNGLHYAVARDITEQKALAEGREDLQLRLRAALDHIKTLEGRRPA